MRWMRCSRPSTMFVARSSAHCLGGRGPSVQIRPSRPMLVIRIEACAAMRRPFFCLGCCRLPVIPQPDQRGDRLGVVRLCGCRRCVVRRSHISSGGSFAVGCRPRLEGITPLPQCPCNGSGRSITTSFITRVEVSRCTPGRAERCSSYSCRNAARSRVMTCSR